MRFEWKSRRWHSWFAWRPVRLTTGDMVWWETVDRRFNIYWGCWDYDTNPRDNNMGLEITATEGLEGCPFCGEADLVYLDDPVNGSSAKILPFPSKGRAGSMGSDDPEAA